MKVDPEVLREAGHSYRVCAGQLMIAAEHHREASRLEYGDDSILEVAGSGHEEFAGSVQRWLDDTATALSNWGRALTRLASGYDTGNLDAARLLHSEVES